MDELQHYANDMTRLLLEAYIKVLLIDIGADSFQELKVDGAETDGSHGYSPKISEWLQGFAQAGNVHPEDMAAYLAFARLDSISQAFAAGKDRVSIRYRRRNSEGEFIWVKMTIRKVDDYSGSNEVAMLYIEDINDEIEAEEELRHTNALLKDAFASATAANSAKSEFMSRMSHDIRTPLNGIIGMTAIAGVHLDDTERVADCLTKITGAGKHLLSLINDILDLSKIESGKVSLTEADFNLPELLDNLLNMVHAPLEERGHELEVHVRNVEHEDVVGDDIRLQQVFINIVSNAIKYTPDGGKIVIDFEELPSNNPNLGRYRFTCEDNGYGMSEAFMGKLFEPFERAEDSRIEQKPGTGLGMAIAQNIINLMGGTISVESREGVGTRFTVDFRVKLQDANNMIAAELVNLPVLVVDDDQVTCESACVTLQEMGMKGSYTLSGAEAVEKVSAAHEVGDDYFACLIDWKMPEMDGVETTRRIRKIVGPDVPIIIISAYEWSDIETEALEAGANGFITKPLFKSRLKAAFTEIPKTLKSNSVVHELDAVEEKDYSGKRTLLVEDNDLNREIAAEIIGMTGASVETAEDGKKAVDMFAASQPGYYDIVFMDVRMPVMDGYEATRAIRAMDRADAATVPIVALTANAFVEDIDTALAAGMNAHMAKPLEPEKLTDMMEQYLA